MPNQHGAGDVNPEPPGAVTSTVQDSYTRSEGSGVAFGLSSYMVFDSEAQGMEIDFTLNPANGNTKQSIIENPKRGGSATGKGNNFEFI